MKKKIRIILASHNIAGHLSGLSQGFLANGVEVIYAATPNRLGYRSDSVLARTPRLFQALGKRKLQTSKRKIFRKLTYMILHDMVKNLMPFWIIAKGNLVFFSYGRTYTDKSWELWLYRLSQTQTCFLFHGSDARPPFLNGALFPEGKPVDYELMRKICRETKQRISRVEKYANFIFAYPAISHFFRRPFFDLAMLGNPVLETAKSASIESLDSSKDSTLTVLHCPSRPRSKGTEEIRNIVNEIQNELGHVNLAVLHDVPNMAVRHALDSADVVINSLWSDSPSGTFPAEALASGKPVIIGSYFAMAYPDIYRGRKMRSPYIFCPPDQVGENLRDLLTDEQQRKRLGLAGRDYAGNYGSLQGIASNYLKCLSGHADPSWICDPLDINYIYGSGAPLTHIRNLVAGYIERFGIKALELDGRPELVAALRDFVADSGRTHEA